ncbi:MAG: class II aldolase/adducin family protein [Geminicoccaceae bacterium]
MHEAEFDALRHLSVRVGRDIEQVQASGGNSSIKAGDIMWVKASGLWLADSLDEEIFVPVRRDTVLAAIEAQSEDDVRASVIDELNPRGLRPSIETSMHALLDHRIVMHTHSVRTIALAVCENAENLLGERLDGLGWAFVPYYKPGMELTRGIAETLAGAAGGRGTNILVLGNHGLVVGGDTVAEVEATLAEVEKRLDGPSAPVTEPPISATAPLTGWKRVEDPLVVSLAACERLREMALDGSYYPDHVVFLGPAASETTDSVSKLLLRPDGAYLPADASDSAVAMVRCLAHVLHRIPSDRAVLRLSLDEEVALMNWDAEKYRQMLER